MDKQNFDNKDTNAFQNNQSGANRSKNLMPAIDLMELARFVGAKKADYYVRKYEQMKSKGIIYNWNWAAFLFSGFWMMYRKMYSYILIFFVIGLASSLFQTYIVTSFSGIILTVLSGFFGNYLYFKYIEKQLKRTSTMSFIEKDNYLKSASGVNKGTIIGLYVGIGFSILLIVILAILQAFHLIPTR